MGRSKSMAPSVAANIIEAVAAHGQSQFRREAESWPARKSSRAMLIPSGVGVKRARAA
jgi:hypothetical protein